MLKKNNVILVLVPQKPNLRARNMSGYDLISVELPHYLIDGMAARACTSIKLKNSFNHLTGIKFIM